MSAARLAELPSFGDLVVDPALASVVVLEAAAHVLVQALVAAHPELLHGARQAGIACGPATLEATRVIAACRDLHEALAGYRTGVLERRRRDRDDDLPF